ncbi:Sensor histidine kinase YycG [Posidoniimonas polymericola]|uniref:histidine kinase n=1 Tax=Posidoniimonas polymericola TaxID=2528002 RepID=A0A5C5YMS2_9BACT|nr:ATP-binding protein [Posidoniimonas polymericola]TWT76139.1 Sensor histidine kinase YycG [Posidoniimonas polymericola]
MISLPNSTTPGVSKAIGLHLASLTLAVAAGVALTVLAGKASLLTALTFGAICLTPMVLASHWGLSRLLRPTAVVERLLAGIDPNAAEPCRLPPLGIASPIAAGWNAIARQAREWTALSELAERVQQGLASAGGESRIEVLDCLTDGVAVTDESGRVVYCNQAFAAICGIADAAEAAGATVPSLTPLTEEASQEIAASPTAMRVNVEFAAAVGENPRTLRITRTPGADAKETLSGHVWTLRDVTQQRLAESMRDRFLTTATHELRTPLANIRAYAESLATVDDIDPESQKRFYNIIQSEAVRLSQLVDDLLDVSRMQAGALAIDRREMDLSRMVEEVTQKVAASIESASIDFRCETPPKYPKIVADKSKLAAAVVNLLGNAVKYTPEGGRVTFRVDLSEGMLEFSVADTGIGIAPEELEHVFDRFFRSDDDRIQEIPGSGLGLSLTQEIARLHGGELTVDSELNVGSIFRMTIPVEEA